RGLQHRVAVRARRDHAGTQTGCAHGLYVTYRAFVPLDTLRAQQVIERFVLRVADALDGLSGRRVIRLALGQVDAARHEERAHPVSPRFAVYVLLVVLHVVERLERTRVARTERAQQRVEGLLPGRGVHGRRLGQHAVHVEQADPDGVFEADSGGVRLGGLRRRVGAPRRTGGIGCGHGGGSFV